MLPEGSSQPLKTYQPCHATLLVISILTQSTCSDLWPTPKFCSVNISQTFCWAVATGTYCNLLNSADVYRFEQKNLAKFSDTCSVRADGLCFSSPMLVGGRKAGNSNVQEFFCTTLYILYFIAPPPWPKVAPGWRRAVPRGHGRSSLECWGSWAAWTAAPWRRWPPWPRKGRTSSRCSCGARAQMPGRHTWKKNLHYLRRDTELG